VSRKDTRITALRASIPEVSPEEARVLHERGAALIDVREPDETAQGSPEGALLIVRGFLELRIEEAVPDPERTVLLMCAGGTRSLFAAEGLKQLGYTDVRSVRGGFHAWKQSGLSVARERVLTPQERERFARHLAMPEVGEKGQLKLLESRVLLVGAGGLGSPAAMYLAAAGVGTLGIVDDDVVDRSNLQRQILHTDERVGTHKTASAARTLAGIAPGVKVVQHTTRLDRRNVEELFRGYELVLDGSDNFATRYLVNDACVKLGLPNVHGSIFRFEGQVSVFWPKYPKRRGPCYRCIFPAPPPPELAPSCAEAGVLGVLPGVIGTLEAIEVIKLLLDIGDPLVGRLLAYDALAQEVRELTIAPDPSCAWCSGKGPVPDYVDYEAFCGDKPRG
jgi:sulfur-carrier protein adenylyltransferase/sulfurtransferase